MASNRIASLVPRNKLGYTGRARRLLRSGERTGRALVNRGLYPRAALVRTYWWEREPNFGDLLTPLLLPDYGVMPLLTPAPQADLIGVGSLIHQLPADYSGVLWGTGLIHDEPTSLPAAQTLAVRGELTLDRLGSPKVRTLGDPGLLLAHKVRRTAPTHDIGVVPHFIHGDEPHFARLISGHPIPVKVVDVRRPPVAVAQAIASCRAIVTSSLHGLIVADALGIPAIWVRSSAALFGGDFKFRDHETVAKPGRIRGHVLADLESLDEAAALATAADHVSIARAQDGLARAARDIPSLVPHSTATPLTLPLHTLAKA